MEKVVIKKSILTDLEREQIEKLYIHCFNDEEKAENWTLETANSYFDERIKEESIFFYIKNALGDIVATIMGSPYTKSFLSGEIHLDSNTERSFYISLIQVHQEFRRKGLSRILLEYSLKDLEQEYENIVIRCREENKAVQALLQSFGFNLSMKYSSSLGGVTCSRCVLEKKL